MATKLSTVQVTIGLLAALVQIALGLGLVFRSSIWRMLNKSSKAAYSMAEAAADAAANVAAQVGAPPGIDMEKSTKGSLKRLSSLADLGRGSLEASADSIVSLTPVKQFAAFQEFKRECKEARVFTSHVRSEENFGRGNCDAALQMPPVYPAERAVTAKSILVLYMILSDTTPLYSAIKDSLGASLIANGVLALGWVATGVGRESWLVYLHLIQTQIGALLNTFRFFPSFLVLGLLSYSVSRWQDWLVNCHTVQARLHDIGTTVGGAVVTPDDPRTRALLFRLYRHLNTVHALTYQSVHPKLPRQLDGFVQLGLLTPREVEKLKPMQNKVRDTLVAWVGGTIELLIREGRVRELAVGNMMIAGLRGICARHHDLFVRNMPNVWFAIAKLLVDYLVYLQLLQLALLLDFSQYDESGGPVALLLVASLITFIASFLVASAFWMAWAMVTLLHNPFQACGDSYNSDALLGSTERQLFAVLRSRFDASDLDGDLPRASSQKAAPPASAPPASAPPASAPPASAPATAPIVIESASIDVVTGR